MDTPSWHRVKEVLEAALERTPGDRSAFVLSVCGGDSALRAEVQSLLDAIERSSDFMIERSATPSLPLSAVFPSGWIPDLGRRALEPGGAFGSFKVVEFVGAGGMGEVYRAHDTSLNRDVALKVRPLAFALDTDRLIRFKREARILASLNHPNIAAIYGVEDSDGVQALVLELVEGPTLASHIAKGRIPLKEALAIAKQIAHGLEAAHQRGIVHSDLKPANIKLRPDGTVKILDFGLAQALDTLNETSSAPGRPHDASASMSRFGLIFGTAAYMSPEQARGEAIDKRTDIWAFGCVLFEILTGRAAFRGEIVEEILVSVLNEEPEWGLLPAETPVNVVKVLRRCLDKDAARRFHDIADARIEIEDADLPTPLTVPKKRRWPAVLTVSAVAALVFAGGVWSWLRSPNTFGETATVRRFEIRLPEEPLAHASLMPLGTGQVSIAITRDGSHIAYVLARDGVTQLYVRRIDQLQATPIPQTQGAFAPFFSPDGRWIGFFAGNKLKKVAVSGGEPIDLCDASNPYGGSWGTDGTILFSPDEGRRPARVRDTGGIPERVVVKNSEGSFRQPDLLPDGKAAIVSNALRGAVGVLSLDTGEFRILAERAGGGMYAQSGHLIFARSGSLWAAPFDLDKLAVTGPESVIVEGVQMGSTGPMVPQAALSDEGTLVYAPGGLPRGAVRPVWVDRKGNAQPLGMPPRAYGNFSLSPDDKRIAVTIADPNRDLWLQDLERGTLTRLTSGANVGTSQWWDNEQIVFSWRTNPEAHLFVVPSDGSIEPRPLTTKRFPTGSLSPDHQLLVGFLQDPVTGQDLYVMKLKGDEGPEPFLRTKFTEVGPTFSPDGRWIAYVSDESGQYEVYVRPYPASEGKWQLSTDGGEHVVWSKDGKELFYRNAQKWMSVAVNLSPSFTAGTPQLLFTGPYAMIGVQSFTVTGDGQRFLVLEPVGDNAKPATHVNVVLNMFKEIQEKTGAAAARGNEKIR